MSWLLQNTLVAASLAVLAWAICRFARPHPATGHVLWLLVLLELVLPPVWSWQVPSMAPAHAAEPAALAVPGRVSATSSPTAAPASPLVAEGRALPSVSPPDVPAARLRAVGGPGFSGLLPWLWVTGSTVFLLAAAMGCRRLAVRMGQGLPAPPRLTAQARDLGRRLGVAVPEIRVLPGLAAPCIWSMGRPRLLWPAALAEAEPAKVRALLAHELAHLRRHDHLVACFEFACAAVVWWHPLFWLARAQLRQQAELACDAWTLWAEPAGRFAYADALIDTLQTESGAERALPLLGARPGARHTFERRLKMILHQEVPRRPSRLVMAPVAALALALLPGLTFAQERTERRPERRAQLEQRIEREVREMVREILREELGREELGTGPQRAPQEEREREREGIEVRIDGRAVELDRELRSVLEEYLRIRDRDRDYDRDREERRARDREEPAVQDPERRGRTGLGGEIGGALREALEEARSEIARDPDLVEMGIAGDVQAILDGLLAGGDPAAMSGALRNVMDKAIDFGLGEARAELEAEGLDPAFLDNIGGALRAGLRGDEQAADEHAGRFGRALRGLIGQGIDTGLKEARAELRAEGLGDVRFLDDLADLLESTLAGREREAEDSARRLQESFQGFLGGALRMAFDEARAELKAEGIDPGFLDETERSLRGELQRRGNRRDRRR